MAEYNQVPGYESGINAYENASTNGLADRGSFDGQHNPTQGVQPITGPHAHDTSFGVPQELEGCAPTSSLDAQSEHGRLVTSSAFACIDCHLTFKNNDQLRKHGKQQSHRPYGCICGTEFARLDTLNRHLTTQSSNSPQYPCEYCYDYQGDKAFHRADHLTQHLTGYHKIETADKLSGKEGQEPAAGTGTGIVEPSLAMPPFPCTVIGCWKWGMCGYLRQSDLDEHVAIMHPPWLQSFGAAQQQLGAMSPYQQQPGTMSSYQQQPGAMPPYQQQPGAMLPYQQNGGFDFTF